MLASAATLVVGIGGAGCNGSHSSETPNNVQTQPGGPCKGASCSPSAGTTSQSGKGTGYGGGSGDGNVNR